ncbi:MAG: TPM domain-containing protein [Clostridia bacterium]|nr:TPM domain-containing protein [Clostridia bacterium]
MKNRLFATLLALVMLLTVASFARIERIIDDADLLTDSQQQQLSQKLDELSTVNGFDIVIATLDSLDGRDSLDMADDIFDYGYFGQGINRDGIILLVSIEDGDWAISTSGRMISDISDNEIDAISQRIVPYMSNGDFYTAFDDFADRCVTASLHSSDYSDYSDDGFDVFSSLLIAIVGGFIIAFIAVSVMKGQLKSVRTQTRANDYLKSGSMHISQSNDIFLYRNVTRRAKPKNNSTGSGTRISSSGRSHGGRSGKF